MNTQQKICRLCLKIFSSHNFHELGEVTNVMLLKVNLKLNLSVSKKGVMCKECAMILQTFCTFKSACIHRENKLSLSLMEEPKLTLKEIWYLEHKNLPPAMDIPEGQEICRFCMKPTGKRALLYLVETVAKNAVLLDLVRKHIPEMNLNITKEVMVCKICLKLLQRFHSFIKICLEVEEGIEKYLQTGEKNNESPRGLGNELQSTSNMTDISNTISVPKVEEGLGRSMESVMKTEDADTVVKLEMKGEHFKDESLKFSFEEEEVEIKLEENTLGSLQVSAAACETKQENHVNSTRCRKNRRKNDPKTPTLIDNKLHKCDQCSFSAKFKCYLDQHFLTHKNPSEVTMYKCDKCSYQNKFKNNLRRHLKIHMKVREITVFNCAECTFKSTSENSVKKYTVTYKCEYCSYKSQQKQVLQSHLLTHKKTLD